MHRLYVVVRADLPPGVQLAQACHAVSVFVAKYPERHREWLENTQNVVVVAASDRRALTGLLELAVAKGIDCASFHEPDLAWELTTFAASGELSPLVSSLPLALRPAKLVAA